MGDTPVKTVKISGVLAVHRVSSGGNFDEMGHFRLAKGVPRVPSAGDGSEMVIPRISMASNPETSGIPLNATTVLHVTMGILFAALAVPFPYIALCREGICRCTEGIGLCTEEIHRCRAGICHCNEEIRLCVEGIGHCIEGLGLCPEEIHRCTAGICRCEEGIHRNDAIPGKCFKERGQSPCRLARRAATGNSLNRLRRIRGEMERWQSYFKYTILFGGVRHGLRPLKTELI